ncbi:NDR1/HIN1-like protein 10 [Quercus suber]|uniref:NDR1/HIN1-like protein 10 n=1 Tax=Quercus suber TaxID=58331 RepID=UPI000CE190B6|nr:NDR1/HIN1-like protein 10 [Quercus suber]
MPTWTEVRAWSRANEYSIVTLTPFYQGHKNISTLGPVFEGQQLKPLFNTEKSVGFYSIDVKLSN